MKVIKNYLYNVGYQILLMIAPLITTPYIARVIGSHGSGINSYTNSWVTFFYLIGQMGITMYGNREIAYHRDNDEERSRIFWGIETLQLCTVFVALLVYLFVVFVFSSTLRKYYLFQSLWIVAAGLDVSWYFMGLEDFGKTVTRNALVKITTIVLIFVIVKLPSDLSKYILLLGLAQVGGNLTLWPYLRQSVHWVPIRTWKPFSHFYPSLLLFIPTITTQIYLVVNRIMLGRMSTTTATGEFDYADKLVKLVLSIVTATGTVMLPHIASKYAKGDVTGVRKSLYTTFDFVTSLAIPMMFGLMAIAEKMAPWFLGTQYPHTGQIIMYEGPVILFIAWSNVTGTQYLMPINRTKEYTFSVTVGAVVNVISNLVLIRFWGAYGAAVASVISEFAVTAVQLHYVKTTIRRRELFANTWRYLIAGIMMFLVVNRLSTIMSMNVMNLIVQVAVGVIIYVASIIIFHAPIVGQTYDMYKHFIADHKK